MSHLYRGNEPIDRTRTIHIANSEAQMGAATTKCGRLTLAHQCRWIYKRPFWQRPFWLADVTCLACLSLHYTENPR